jgi:hypothetical protein
MASDQLQRAIQAFRKRLSCATSGSLISLSFLIFTPIPPMILSSRCRLFFLLFTLHSECSRKVVAFDVRVIPTCVLGLELAHHHRRFRQLPSEDVALSYTPSTPSHNNDRTRFPRVAGHLLPYKNLNTSQNVEENIPPAPAASTLLRIVSELFTPGRKFPRPRGDSRYVALRALC